MDNPFATFALWSGLLGGLALFLFGLDILTQALKSAAGDFVKDLLAKLTRNRLVGMAVGAFTTAVIQSSSVTTVLLVGFISAGLISLSQSVAVIIGANIGTTFTAQILAFRITNLALPLVAAGFTVSALARQPNWHQLGIGILGLGLVFYGMVLMSEGMRPLRDYEPFVRFMLSMNAPLLAAAVGCLFTAVVQSSSAAIGVVLAMASQGLIGLEPAIAIVMGANVGTCITAGLAAIGKPREAVRAAVVHTMFNIAGVLIWIWFIPQLAELARSISPSHEELTGVARTAAELPRQIANIHSLFNVINAVLFIGFTPQFARIAEWLVPDKPITPDKALLPKYLDESLLSTPSIALETVRLEIGRLGERVHSMFRAIMPAAISGTRAELEQVAEMDKAVDALHLAIIDYLGKVSLTRLSSRQSAELLQLVQVANDLEQIGDRVATSMVTSASKRIREGVRVSPDTARVLTDYHAYIADALRDVLTAVTEEDPKLAKQVQNRKKDFSQLSRKVVEHGLERLTADEPNRLKTYAREMELVEILDGVFTIVRRLARSQAHLAD